MYKIIGITGVARVGKDTLFKCISDINSNIRVRRAAFADELKNECDDFLRKNINISAFTERDEEKSIIRPFLVTYGTHVRRKLDKNCWIKKLNEKINASEESESFIITDVRFENEAKWIKNKKGILVHLSRQGILPANKDESEQDPILKSMSDIKVNVPTFKDDYMSQVKNIIQKKEELCFK
tara:strand:+ start:151 stop:696 length:546 start_codon:yes stop_codon:yes gene_type:complete